MTRNTGATDIPDTIQFVLEIDKLKGVLRKVRPIWEERYENTAEHSWQIALFAMSMARTLELKIDVTLEIGGSTINCWLFTGRPKRAVINTKAKICITRSPIAR